MPFLKLLHNFGQVVDTSRVFPHPSGPHQRHKLKFLAKQHLIRYLEINLYIPDSRIQLSDVRVLLFLVHVLRGPPNALALDKDRGRRCHDHSGHKARTQCSSWDQEGPFNFQ